MDFIDTVVNARIPKTTLTTTGDLLVASAPNTPTRLGVGSAGQFLSVSGGLPAWVAAPGGNPSVGTAFPGSPADGDEYVYTADATNGVYWRFKWIASASKWVFLGGPPLLATVSATESTTSSTYVALTTAGPSITLPFAGDYDVVVAADINIELQNDSAKMSYDIGGTAAVDADMVELNLPATGGVMNGFSYTYRLQRKTGLTAVTLTAKYRTLNGGTNFFKNRTIAVTPVRK